MEPSSTNHPTASFFLFNRPPPFLRERARARVKRSLRIKFDWSGIDRARTYELQSEADACKDFYYQQTRSLVATLRKLLVSCLSYLTY